MWKVLLASTIGVAVSCLGAKPVWAYPFLPLRPVPSAMAGPADPHVAAVFYNPAALGPLEGTHVYVDGEMRLLLGNIRLAPGEGQSGGSTSLTEASFNGFAGASWGNDRLTIALAAFTPLSESSSFPVNSPVRYQEIGQLTYLLQESAAVSVRLDRRLFVGAAVSFAEGWLDYRYAHDAAVDGGNGSIDKPGLCGAAPCGLGNPSAAELVRLRGFGWGIGFSLGILGQPTERVWLGLSYTSHIFSRAQANDFAFFGERAARVTAAPGERLPNCTSGSCPPDTFNGNDIITMAVPDLLQAAVRIAVTPKIEFESTLRWVHYGSRSQIAASIQGGNLAFLTDATPGHPRYDSYLLDRGLIDAVALESSVRFRWGTFRLAPSLTVESPAVERSAVSAAAIDAPKIDISLLAEWRPSPHLYLAAALGGVAYILGHIDSRYSSRAAADCVDAGYNPDRCQATLNGYALPSATGQYSAFLLHLSAALGIDY